MFSRDKEIKTKVKDFQEAKVKEVEMEIDSLSMTVMMKMTVSKVAKTETVSEEEETETVNEEEKTETVSEEEKTETVSEEGCKKISMLE